MKIDRSRQRKETLGIQKLKNGLIISESVTEGYWYSDWRLLVQWLKTIGTVTERYLYSDWTLLVQIKLATLKLE